LRRGRTTSRDKGPRFACWRRLALVDDQVGGHSWRRPNHGQGSPSDLPAGGLWAYSNTSRLVPCQMPDSAVTNSSPIRKLRVVDAKDGKGIHCRRRDRHDIVGFSGGADSSREGRGEVSHQSNCNQFRDLRAQTEAATRLIWYFDLRPFGLELNGGQPDERIEVLTF
jgi:hypothetical protein